MTTCQAKNTEPAVRAVAGYLAQGLGLPVHVHVDIPWQERERKLDAANIDIGWVCSAWYALKSVQYPRLKLLVAPVMSGPRYDGRPVYFSDLLVRRASPFHAFEDLQGAVWAYNEPNSYSGRYVMLHRLVTAGFGPDFFRDVVRSGSHLNSLSLILEGRVDTAAIDSTVFDFELRKRPELYEQIRVLETLGPSPVPPWILSSPLPGDLEEHTRSLLLHMHETEEGRAALATGGLARFAPAEDDTYDVIRSVLATVQFPENYAG